MKMTMQEAMMNKEIASLDLSKVAALQQKRTVAFVNHFVSTTVQFLNNFMKKCEHKLMHFERKLEKVEANMVLLEARLSSIPEVNISQTETKPQKTQFKEATESPNTSSKDTIPSMSALQSKNPINETDSVPSDNKQTESTKTPPEFERFIKMVQVGVPLQAVKLKASLEGLDPNVLEKLLGK